MLSSGYFFRTRVRNRKRKAGEGLYVRQNQVGAAWSAYRMVAYKPAHGAEICPLSVFLPLPEKCPGKRLVLWDAHSTILHA